MRSPDSLAHDIFGYNYAAKGMYAEAIAAYQQAIKLDRSTPSTQIYLETSKEYVSPGELAVLYAALGECERAFASVPGKTGARGLLNGFVPCEFAVTIGGKIGIGRPPAALPDPPFATSSWSF